VSSPLGTGKTISLFYSVSGFSFRPQTQKEINMTVSFHMLRRLFCTDTSIILNGCASKKEECRNWLHNLDHSSKTVLLILGSSLWMSEAVTSKKVKNITRRSINPQSAL